LRGGKDLTGRLSPIAPKIVIPNRADATTLGEQRMAHGRHDRRRRHAAPGTRSSSAHEDLDVRWAIHPVAPAVMLDNVDIQEADYRVWGP
jgi:hypothetical protein